MGSVSVAIGSLALAMSVTMALRGSAHAASSCATNGPAPGVTVAGPVSHCFGGKKGSEVEAEVANDSGSCGSA